MSESICKGCGARIVWARCESTTIPLDPRAPVYRVRETGSGRNAALEAERMPRTIEDHTVAFLVSHFATCPKANQCSASRKKKIQPVEILVLDAVQGFDQEEL